MEVEELLVKIKDALSRGDVAEFTRLYDSFFKDPDIEQEYKALAALLIATSENDVKMLGSDSFFELLSFLRESAIYSFLENNEEFHKVMLEKLATDRFKNVLSPMSSTKKERLKI